MLPHQYPRRILLCVSGTSPQIITETLFALAVETEGRPIFLPTEVRVLTTSKGAEQARLSLLAEDRNMFRRLCRDYGLHGIHFDASCIEVFRGVDGQPLEDILSPGDNELAADHITRVVAELSRDENAAIHASIAGGRKTMGFYLGYAMSLFGREQDRVSHVLVSEGFDGHREFFYKPPRPVTLRNPVTGWEMSTSDARIHLAEIPIVRLRSNEFEAVSSRSMGFSEAVERANRRAGGGDGLHLTIRRDPGGFASTIEARIGGEALELTQPQAFLLHWFALRRIEGMTQPGREWVSRSAFRYPRGTAKGLGYLDELYRLAESYGPQSSALQSLQQGLEGNDTESERMREPIRWLEPLLSKINRAIRKATGSVGVGQYGLMTEGQRGKIRYRLAMPPERIRIEPNPASAERTTPY